MNPKFSPVTILDEASYGYKQVQDLGASHRDRWAVTAFDDTGDAGVQTMFADLSLALLHAGQFRDSSRRSERCRDTFESAVQEAKKAGQPVGEFGYVSWFRPFFLTPPILSGTEWRNVGTRAVIFSAAPLPLEVQESLELTAVSPAAFLDLAKQKTSKEFSVG